MNELNQMTLALVAKWDSILNGYPDFKPIRWSETTTFIANDRGVARAIRLKAQVERNLSVMEYVAGERAHTDEDLAVLRSYYKQYRTIRTNLNDAIDDLNDIIARRTSLRE